MTLAMTLSLRVISFDRLFLGAQSTCVHGKDTTAVNWIFLSDQKIMTSATRYGNLIRLK